MDVTKQHEIREPLIQKNRASSNTTSIDDETAFSLSGGFGKFQFILVISLFISFCYQGCLSYNLYLFELEPEYL